MGVARIFQRGGHTDSYRGYSSDCHLNIVSCLLTRRLTKGGSRAPQDPPGYAYGHNCKQLRLLILFTVPEVLPSILRFALSANFLQSNIIQVIFRAGYISHRSCLGEQGCFGEQGWCSGESARLPPMCPGFDSRTRRHMWAEFVGSLLCSERFFSGNSGFPLSSKTNI